MTNPVKPSHVPDEDLYLEQLAELSSAVSDALFAIGGDSVEQLEDSLWRQQILCVTLQRSLQNLSSKGLSRSALQHVIHAFRELTTLNASYALLVEQARSSTELLYQLCFCYSHSSQLPEPEPAVPLSLEA